MAAPKYDYLFDPNEPYDIPKKFKNIDKEPFEFSWDGKKLGGMLGKKEEIKPGETVTLPRYLTVHAAKHLTKKILKREAIDEMKKTREYERYGDQVIKHARINFRNDEKGQELVKKMLAPNFEGEEEEEKEKSKGEFVCEVCGKECGSRIGLISHSKTHKK